MNSNVGNMTKSSLAVFCLEYDAESILVSHSPTWVKELRKHFKTVIVYAVHKGKFESEDGIVVREIGGGNLFARIRAFYRLIQAAVHIIRNRSEICVFHHMVTEPLALIGGLLRIVGIQQVLWYSHSNLPLSLRIGFKFVNRVASPTRECFPISNSMKITETGHGIALEKFEVSGAKKREKRIVVIGRISRIKNLHLLLEALVRVRQEDNIEVPVDFIGPILDQDYFVELQKFIAKHQVVSEFYQAIPQVEVPGVLEKYEYAFNGNPATIDKSAVESCLMGCLLISEIIPVQQITGMENLWKELSSARTDLVSQIRLLERLGGEGRERARIKTINSTREKNSLNVTIKRIAKTLSEI